MSSVAGPNHPPGHNHKVVFLYASHRQILLPETFRILYYRSTHDAVLRAFLSSAYHALRHEALAASDSEEEPELSPLPVLPNTFEDLAAADAVESYLPYTLSLTTLAHLAVVLGSRQELTVAMQDGFAAVWDPESFLAMKLLRTTALTSRLALIAKAVEVIKLAFWLDFYLIPSNKKFIEFAKQRITIRGQGVAIESIAERCRKDSIPYADSLCGFAMGLDGSANLSEGRSGGQDAEHGKVVTIERSAVPILSESEWSRFLSKLEHRLRKRQIRVKVGNDEAHHLPSRSDPLCINLNLSELLCKADEGRSYAHFQTVLELLREQLDSTCVYAPRIHFLRLGGAMDDACAMQVTNTFAALQLPYSPVNLLHLLYPKDSYRLGDEPVKLSKVQGNPCQQVAIIGMSCRVPGADDADALWQLLKEGRDMCEEIPARLYPYQDYHSASYRDRNVMRVKTGNFIASAGLFDKSILGESVSIEHCAKLDPQQRVAILTAHETLQKAGYGFSRHRHPEHPERWSTHLAYCSDDYREHLSQRIEADFVSNSHRAHLVAKINETFGFRGEACTYDTACSSALVAVEAACNSLLAGETSAALTGGVNILTQPQITIGLDRGFFLSPSSQCLTLDDAGAGYSRADAVSIMLLKRLSDAVKDGDPVLAIISSASTNHSGESFSITHPHGPTQKRLYQAGMLASKTLPRDYTYIEMHGTGTQSGDFEEVSGIVQTFGKGQRDKEAPLVIGSVKANIGHSEAASGATSMIKTVQIYEHGEVPRHIGIRTKLNTKLPPLDGLHIPLQETRLAGINSAYTLVDNFSAAGGNSSIVMDRGSSYRRRLSEMSENAIEKSCPASTAGTQHCLLIVTAATPFSLDVKRRRLIAFLEANQDISLREFCSTVSLSDPLYPFRLIATPSSLMEAKNCLSSQESVYVSTGSAAPNDCIVGIAFSGQGAQYLDMARELYEKSGAFRAHVDHCNFISLTLGLPNLVEVIHPLQYPQDGGRTGAGTPLRQADIVNPAQYQLALVAIEVGLASMLIDWGLKPTCVVGHSLGEYTALWLSSVITLRSLIELVGRRSLLMMELCERNASSMLAVREGHNQVRDLLEQAGYEKLEIACLNSPKDTVVAGRTEQIEELLRCCERMDPKIKAMAIPVPYAFHSTAVEPLMDKYEGIASRHRFSPPRINIASNVFGRVLSSESSEIDSRYLVRHLRQPVRFVESIQDLQAKVKVDTWIEIGPHPVCIPMLKGCYEACRDTPTFIASLRRGISSWSSTLDLVKELATRGAGLDWSRVFEDLGLRFYHHGLSADLPLYPFDLEEYWVPFRDRGLRDHLMVTPTTSGSPPALASPEESAARGQERATPAKWPKPQHSLLWQCVELKTESPSATFLARVNQRPFQDFIRGHIILGMPLAPATVFVELAQEAGMYWWLANPEAFRATNRLEEDVIIEVLDLSMVASLYLNENDPRQSIEITLQGSPASSDGSIVQFFSHSLSQQRKHQYGSCRIRILDREDVTRDWAKLSHLIMMTSCMVKSRPASLLRRDTIYNYFKAIVLYLDGFRGINTVWMTERGDEAVSEVKYHADAVNGRFLCSPMLLDSLGGLTGFISNVSFAEGPFVYMAEIIGRVVTMPGLREFQPGGTTIVQVYARMEQDEELSKGTAYFFLPNGDLMGLMENIVFKRVRRDMLTRLVQLSSKAFANEAAEAARTRESKADRPQQPKLQSDNKAVQAQKELEIKGAASPVLAFKVDESRGKYESQCDSPMDVLTNPNQHSLFTAPLHIGGPVLRHFDNQNVLFMFPDGSGTAQIWPKVRTAESLSVYGFDSPYLGQIGAWSRGIAELVDLYIETLYNVQSAGPYKLAGWSIGGVFALEVARRLLSAGHKVAFLGLIDTPSPRQIKPLPTNTLDEMLSKITSKTVREHFRSCALSLPGYRCLPFHPTDRMPAKIVIVNASDTSRLKDVMADDYEWRSFWSSSANLVCHEVSGDHWTCLGPALELVVGAAQ